MPEPKEILESKKIAKVTISTFQDKKQHGEKITALTAYDFSMATIIDDAGIDLILVGDSAANVFAGHTTTLPITLDQMIYHASSVTRAVKRSFVVVDLPFGSYQGSIAKALDSAIRVMKEASAQGIKMEGGSQILPCVEAIVAAGIPVMGHLGLMPQSIHQLGSYMLRAQKEAEAHRLREDALALQSAGCFAIVLEKIPAKLGKEVTVSLHVPTIGIGAGAHCDGQILVLYDLLGLNKMPNPKFARRYVHLYELISDAAKSYICDVQAGDFPNEAEQY